MCGLCTTRSLWSLHKGLAGAGMVLSVDGVRTCRRCGICISHPVCCVSGWASVVVGRSPWAIVACQYLVWAAVAVESLVWRVASIARSMRHLSRVCGLRSAIVASGWAAESCSGCPAVLLGSRLGPGVEARQVPAGPCGWQEVEDSCSATHSAGLGARPAGLVRTIRRVAAVRRWLLV